MTRLLVLMTALLLAIPAAIAAPTLDDLLEPRLPFLPEYEAPGFSHDGAPTTLSRSMDDWVYMVQMGSARAQQDDAFVDRDIYPLGDANGDGLSDFWKAAYGDDSDTHEAVDFEGRTIWTYTTGDDEYMFGAGDVNKDDVMDFAVLAYDGSEAPTWTILDGRNLDVLVVAEVGIQTYQLGPFTFTFYSFPISHPDKEGLLYFEYATRQEGGYVADVGIASYGHEGETNDLTVRSVDFDGVEEWSTTFTESYTQHSVGGFWDPNDDDQTRLLVNARHDPDEDHVEVANTRPLDEEPPESIRVHTVDLASGAIADLITFEDTDSNIVFSASAGSPTADGPALVIAAGTLGIILTGNGYELVLETHRALVTADAKILAEEYIDDDLVFTSSVGDQDGDGYDELLSTHIFNGQSALETGGFNQIWQTKPGEFIGAIGADLDGDGRQDLVQLFEDEQVDDIEVAHFITALEREVLWTLEVDDTLADIDVIDDVDNSGDVDFLMLRFPLGDNETAEMDERDGFAQLIRGRDGAMFWEAQVYEGGSEEFPRLSTFAGATPDTNGDSAPDIWFNMEFIPRVTSYSCNSTGCTEEKEEGTPFDVMTAFSGVNGERLLRVVPASPVLETMNLNSPVEGEASKDLEKVYAPGPGSLVLLAIGLLAVAIRRRD